MMGNLILWQDSIQQKLTHFAVSPNSPSYRYFPSNCRTLIGVEAVHRCNVQSDELHSPWHSNPPYPKLLVEQSQTTIIFNEIIKQDKLFNIISYL